MPPYAQDVFLCFAPADRELATTLRRRLEANGLKVEWPDAAAQQVLPEALESVHAPFSFVEIFPQRFEQCQLLIVLLSPGSVQSEFVKAVMSAWLERRREGLIPVLVNDWADWQALPEAFRYLKFVRTWRLPADLDSLVEATGGRLGRSPTQPNCRHCGKPISLLDEIVGAFCCDAHKQEYGDALLESHFDEATLARDLPDLVELVRRYKDRHEASEQQEWERLKGELERRFPDLDRLLSNACRPIARPAKQTACLYCGQPLSKLRSLPGDFCSGEHEQEYRDAVAEGRQCIDAREAAKAAGEKTPQKAEPPGAGVLLRRIGVVEIETRLGWQRATGGIQPPSPAERKTALQDFTSAAIPGQTTADNVHFTVTAPAALAPASTFELHFWAHLEAQRDAVIARALRESGTTDVSSLLVRSEGPVELARGTVLTVYVEIQDLLIAHDCKLVRWAGEIGCAIFLVSIPGNVKPGPKAASASIRVNGIEIACMSFLLNVCAASVAEAKPVPGEIKRHRCAFASYASQDRDAVLARVQGIQKAAPSLDVFLDVMSLRSGQDWEQRLLAEIARADVFYLFWCRHASASEWVEKEWRCAFASKGLEFIDPVPLEPPQLAPPPAELARKHFNDPVLAFMKGLHNA